MQTSAADSDIRATFRAISDDAKSYFTQTKQLATRKYDGFVLHVDAEHYWSQLPDDLRDIADTLSARLLAACKSLADATKGSPLAGSEDQRDVKLAAKRMRAALRLRSYDYREAEVLHDEGAVLGFRPAEQGETGGLPPEEAETEFFNSLADVNAVLKLVEASGGSAPVAAQATTPDASKYRAGTAFIMMWMDQQHPELTDVADAVRSVFRSFEIRAVRADDIEHEGLITERVLNEIRTSEFLFADLTGMRPNVYYEVGFAHALGKRVILFRQSGTGIHFDLAGYNCPEYENLRDLREKLTKRLVSLTNRNPKPGEEI